MKTKKNLLILFANVIFASSMFANATNKTDRLLNSYTSNLMFLDNTIVVSNISHLPDPIKNEITLDATKSYILSGMVDIGDNYINLNGAGLTGVDPGKDGVSSKVKGAVLRSRDNYVYLCAMFVVCGSTETSAYDFEDISGTKACNLYHSTSVLDAPNIKSKGVGVIKGFETTCINLNLWQTADGLKVGGTSKKLTLTAVYIRKLDKIGVEFLDDANIEDVIINSVYFTYEGDLGIKISPLAKIDQGRMAYNFFRGPKKQLEGFDSFSPGWEMNNNGYQIPDSKGKGYIYFNDNKIPTKLSANEFTKIIGTTIPLKTSKFSISGDNKLTYTGKRLTNLEITATISAVSNIADGSYSIAIMKNGKELILPKATANGLAKGRGFELRLDSQVQLISGDFIELFVRSNTSDEIKEKQIVITDMQLKVYEQ